MRLFSLILHPSPKPTRTASKDCPLVYLILAIPFWILYGIGSNDITRGIGLLAGCVLTMADMAVTIGPPSRTPLDIAAVPAALLACLIHFTLVKIGTKYVPATRKHPRKVKAAVTIFMLLLFAVMLIMDS